MPLEVVDFALEAHILQDEQGHIKLQLSAEQHVMEGMQVCRHTPPLFPFFPIGHQSYP